MNPTFDEIVFRYYFVWMEPRLNKILASLETLDDHWKKDLSSQRLWRVHSDAVSIRLLKDWMPDSNVQCILKSDLFDEALSEGLYPFLYSKGNNVICIDISMSILRDARARYQHLRAVAADVRCLPIHDRIFDVIISNSTLDHFESQDEIVFSLRELHRVLRPNGLLLITLDNPFNPMVSIRNSLPFNLLRRMWLVPYYVGATFGPSRLRSVLDDIGFEVKEITAVMHCPRFFAITIARILNNREKYGLKKRFLSFLMSFESLSRSPLRLLTGHFLAPRAIKR